MIPAAGRENDPKKTAEPHDKYLVELENELTTLRALVSSGEATASRLRLRQMELEIANAQITEESKKKQANLKETHRKELEKHQVSQTELSRLSDIGKIEAVSGFREKSIEIASKFGYGSRSVGPTFGFSPDAFYGGQHHKDIRILERIAMKMGSVRARQAIALGATDNQQSLDDLLVLARANTHGLIDSSISVILARWNKRSLLSLARVIADQSLFPSDKADAVALFDLAITAFGRSSLDARAKYILLETLQDLGLSGRLEEEIHNLKIDVDDPVQTGLLRCNELMSDIDIKTNGLDEWLAVLEPLYTASDLAPILDVLPGEDLLGRLSATAAPIDDGPLVSVIMPTYNGSEWIHTAVRSIIDQTWRNLELIIVDDFSDDKHWKAVKNLHKLDDRIQVFQMEGNQGAYRTRNFAFDQTSGEYLTVHDDDDWSHPQKIEVQIRNLLENDSVVGNMSFQTRIDEKNKFLRINDNPSFNQRNYSSMMLRRDLVVQLGGWIDINRAADAEFHDRVRVLTGSQIVGISTPPLSLMRARVGSLTSGEISKGALDFARQTLGLLYQTWHISLAQQISDGTHTSGPVTDHRNLPFTIPANMAPGQRRVSFDVFDVIFITDFRFPGGNSQLVAAEISAAVASGLKVGIIQLDSPVLRANHAFNRLVSDVVNRLRVPVLTLHDNIRARLVVIRNPTVLQFAERLRPNLAADKVAIVVNTAPLSRNGLNYCFDLIACEQSAQNMFSLKALVYPESPQTRALASAIFPSANYSIEDWPGFIDLQPYLKDRHPNPTRRPVVGRHSRDHSLKWPDTEKEIRDAYVQPNFFDTHILGGAASIIDRIDLSLEPTVTVSPFGSIEPSDFLPGIDFWVYQHSSHLTESFGMSIVEAMASGAVVILPRYLEPLFGDAAIYASENEVSRIVGEYWDNQAEYATQSRKAVNEVRNRFSADAFARHLIQAVNKPANGRLTQV